MQAPAQLPTFNIDAQASTVLATGPQAGEGNAEEIRSTISWALSDMMQGRSGLEEAPPARFSAKVDYEIESWPVAACLLVLSLVGCPMAAWTADVDLVLEVDGKVYRGSGRHTAAAGIYYNNNGLNVVVGATEKAVANALSGPAEGGSETANETHEQGAHGAL